MIAVIKTTGGTFNVIGTANEEFIIQGNLTLDQMRELQVEVEAALNQEEEV